MEELSRNKLQEVSMDIIYNFLTLISLNEPIDVKKIISDQLECDFDDADDYVKQVTINVILKYNDIVDEFQKNMTKWKFSRLNRVSQSILLLGYSSYKFVGNIDKGAIINVCVNLAKKYLDQGDYKFINGVLDKTL